MSNSGLEFWLGQLSGLVALIAGLLVWRLSALREIKAVLKSRKDCRDKHIVPTSFIMIEGLQWARLGLLAIGMALFVWALMETRHFMMLVDYLTDGSVAMDSAVDKQYRLHAQELQQGALTIVFYCISVLLGEWLLGLCLPTALGTLNSDLPLGHPFVLPKEWRNALGALWEERLSVSDNGGGQFRDRPSSGAWSPEWQEWARVVSTYHASALRKGADATTANAVKGAGAAE